MAETVRYYIDLQGADQAADELGALGRGADATRRDLDDLAAAGARTGQEMDELKDASGETDSVLKGLAGAIGIVSPELEGLASAAGDAAGGFEAVLRGGPKLAGVLGIITAALTAAAFAWKVYNDELEAAEQKQADAAERALEVAEAQAELQEFLAGVELRRAVAAGEVDESALITAAGTAQAEAAFMERKLQIEGDINRELEARRDLQNAINEAANAGDTFGTKELERQRAALDIRLNGARDQLAGLEQQTISAAVAIAETLATGTSGGAPVSGGSGGGDEWKDGGFLNKITNPGAITGTSVNAGFSGLSANLDFSTPGAFEALMARTSDQRAALGAAGSAAGGALGGLATGNVNPLLSVLPGGGLLGGVANVGALGADGVGDLLDTFTEAFTTGLKELPEILSEVIPEFAVTLVTELIPALIASAPELFASLIVGIAKAIKDTTTLSEGEGFLFNGGGTLDKAFGGNAAGEDLDPAFIQNLEDRINGRSSARRSSSITRPQAPIRGGSGQAPINVILGGELGTLIDRIDIEQGPNGSRPRST